MRTQANALPWLLVSVLVIALDQLSKFWALSALQPAGEPHPVIPGFLNWTLAFNTGAAFSFLAEGSGWQRWFFIGLAVSVSVAIGVWLARLPPSAHKLTAAGLALVLGGALGNVIDRIRIGSVVDFIHFHWYQAYFPAFNVADSAITVGAGLLLLDALLDSRRKS